MLILEPSASSCTSRVGRRRLQCPRPAAGLCPRRHVDQPRRDARPGAQLQWTGGGGQSDPCGIHEPRGFGQGAEALDRPLHGQLQRPPSPSPLPQKPPRHHHPAPLRVHQPEVAGGAGQLHHLDGDAVGLTQGAEGGGAVGVVRVHQAGEGRQSAQAGLDGLRPQLALIIQQPVRAGGDECSTGARCDR